MVRLGPQRHWQCPNGAREIKKNPDIELRTRYMGKRAKMEGGPSRRTNEQPVERNAHKHYTKILDVGNTEGLE